MKYMRNYDIYSNFLFESSSNRKSTDILRNNITTSEYRSNDAEMLLASKSGDPYDDSASDYICWDAKTPVKLRMGNKYPENMPPILCQTMLRNTVNQYPGVIAVSFKKDNVVVKWTYQVFLVQFD